MSSTKRLSAAIVVALLITGGVAFWLLLSDARHASFNSAIWKSTVSSRRAMLPDLRRNVLHAGMTERQVLALLGNPNESLEAKDVWKPDSRAAYYLYFELDRGDAFERSAFVVVLDKQRNTIDSMVFQN